MSAPDLAAQIAAVERAFDYWLTSKTTVSDRVATAAALNAALATLRAVPGLVAVCRKTVATAVEGLRELQDAGFLSSGARILELERELAAALAPFAHIPDPPTGET